MRTFTYSVSSGSYTHRSQATVTNDIVRWVSNGRVPPEDVIEAMLKAGLITSTERNLSLVMGRTEMRAAIADYVAHQRANPRTPGEDAEYRAELRAAFGPGETVMNVFTGERIKT